MLSSRRFAGLMCILASFTFGCTQSDATKTTTADKSTKRTPAAKQPETPASPAKSAEAEKKPTAVVARAKDNETKPVPELPAVAKPKEAAEPKASTATASTETPSAPEPNKGPQLVAADQAPANASDSKEKQETKTTVETKTEPKAESKPAEEAPLTESAAGLAGQLEEQNVVPEGEAQGGAKELPELTVGSVAPKLDGLSWIKGEPVDEFKPKQIYVVEFWATWCGPCIHSMPHVAKLQDEYGDKVRFIGVSVDDQVDAVNQFMDQEQSPGKKWNEVLTYAIAHDKNGTINRDYMQASKQPGIPTAFIVGRDGKIDWIGHPMGIDDTIAQVVADKWDRAAAIAEIENQKKIEKAVEAINLAARKKDWDGALKIVDEIIAANPKMPQLQFMKLQVLQFAGKKEEAAKLRPELVKLAWDQPDALLQLAFSVVSEEDGPTRDLELALKAANRAHELTEGQAPATMMVIARVYHAQGKLDEAIEWAKKFVDATQGHESAVEMLKGYEAEKAKGPQDQGAAAPKAGEEKKADEEKKGGEEKKSAEEKKPADEKAKSESTEKKETEAPAPPKP